MTPAQKAKKLLAQRQISKKAAILAAFARGERNRAKIARELHCAVSWVKKLANKHKIGLERRERLVSANAHVTPIEHTEACELAAKRGLSLSAFMRSVLVAEIELNRSAELQAKWEGAMRRRINRGRV